MIFSKKRGISVPTALEMSIASTREMPMQPDTANENSGGCPLSSRIYSPTSRKEIPPRMSPLQKPTRISFQTRRPFWAMVRFSSVRTRIVTARDCVPTLPAISRIRDWKAMISVSCATTLSNAPTTVDTTIPSPSRISSQGMRFFMLSGRVSLRSSSAVRPASLA